MSAASDSQEVLKQITDAGTFDQLRLKALQELKQEGYKIFAVEQVEKSLPLQEFTAQHAGKTVVVFGNEVSGVGEEALAFCDGSVEIPQWGMKHSLNISIAAGIVLWELARSYRFTDINHT